MATEFSKLASLSGIPLLESLDGWVNWDRKIRDHLKMCGFADILGRKRDPPTTANSEGPNTGQTATEAWEEKQERAMHLRKRHEGSQKEVRGEMLTLIFLALHGKHAVLVQLRRFEEGRETRVPDEVGLVEAGNDAFDV